MSELIQAEIGTELSSDELARERAVLLRRAEMLARRSDSTGPVLDLALLAFELGEERFALELSVVRAVVPLQRYTRVPGAPAEVLGVTIVRGELLPLMDLAKVFGLPSAETELGHAVVCEGGLKVALRVKKVLEVFQASKESLQSPDLAGSRSGLLQGVLPNGTAVISLEALFVHPALGSQSRLLTGPGE